jgi:hypothetical protein
MKIFGWAHHEGILNGKFGLKDNSYITPEDSMRELGLEDMYFVVYEDGPPYPYQKYYERFKDFPRVNWSVTGADGYTCDKQREAVIDLLKTRPNLEGVVMDDFFKTAPEQWLSQIGPDFPVTINFEFEKAVTMDAVKVTQSDMPFEQGRTADYKMILQITGGSDITLSGSLADEPGVSRSHDIAPVSVTGLTLIIESSHDICGIRRCGIKQLALLLNGTNVAADAGKITADIPDGKFKPADIFKPKNRPLASMSIEELSELKEQIRERAGRDVRWSLVVYTGQVAQRVKDYFDFFDNIILCVWKADEFGRLDKCISRLRDILEPSQKISLVIYLFDFGNEKKMPLEDMMIQLEKAKQLSDKGVCDEIILVSPNLCDLGYPAVEYARKWIKENKQ